MKVFTLTVCAVFAASTSIAATKAYFDFDDAYSDKYDDSGWKTELWEHSGDLSVKITHDYGWVQTYEGSGLTAWHGAGDGSHQIDSYSWDDTVHFDFYYKGEAIDVDLHKITFNAHYSAGQWWDDFELLGGGESYGYGDASWLTAYEKSDAKESQWSVRADGFHEFVEETYSSSMDGWKSQYMCDKTKSIRDRHDDGWQQKSNGKWFYHRDYDYKYKCASAFKITGIKVEYHEPAPIPLPAAGWLMIAGLGGLAAMRRRKTS